MPAMSIHDEDDRLRSVAIQNAQSILAARQRAEAELERRTAELDRSLAMLRATLEATTDAIIVTDAEGRITQFNENYAALWPVPRALLESGDHRRVLHQVAQGFADPAAFLARVEEIYRASPAESFDVLALADGRVIERHSRIQFVESRNVGRVWSFRDVSEARRNAAALEEEKRVLELLNRTGATLASHLDLQALLQNVTDSCTQLSGARFGAFFYNSRDPETGDVLMLYTLSGAPREAFEKFGHPRATPLFGPTFRGESTIRIADVKQDPRYGRMGPHHGMPPGHLPVRSYLAVPVISRSGEVLGGLFFGHPQPGVFTERAERIVAGVAAQAAIAVDNARLYEAAQRAAEERKILLDSERRARTEAEHASELKDEFLATLSHELRTPLSAILGWSMILRQHSFDEAELDRGLQTIERNARVQTRLIEDLLDMSRIASGKLRLEVQPVEPVVFIEAAIETVRPAAEAKGIRLETHLEHGAGTLLGDPGRLQQVVWNLLSNAIKFTGRGGQVTVATTSNAGQVEIAVSDTGIGIRPEFLPFVFDRFRQADASSTRPHGGLGLGLSIARNLVELHGGTISVASAGENRGATFIVRLPVAATGTGERRPPSIAEAEPPLRHADLSGVRVLVVDDEPDARDLVSRVLGGCAADVVTAESAADALEKVEREKPDVLVSDIGMPDMDGYELLRKVRGLGQERGGRVPAIALTAFARSEDRRKALRAGFLVHVPKPVEPAELIATVASVVGRTPADEPNVGG